MTDVSRPKASRSAQRNALSGLITKAKMMMNTANKDGVAAKIEMIKTKFEKIEVLNEKIQELIEEKDIAQDVDECTVFEETVMDDLTSLEKFLKPKEENKQGTSPKTPESKFDAKQRYNVFLPKIQIKKFAGDPIAWQEFHDIFTATVESNQNLSDIHKFTYLKTNLEGPAERCIENIPLTNDNYAEAMKMLVERYGNKQLTIATHVGKLLKLEKVHSRDVREVRNLYDKIESHVRCLVTANVKKEEVGPLLIPIVLERLPDDIKLQVSRIIGNANWHIEKFMDTLRDEITARENCEFMSSHDGETANRDIGRKDGDSPMSHFTSHELMNNARTLECAFCKKNHYHDQCRTVIDVDERKKIARKKNLCYKCLTKDHMIKNCRNSRKCYNCKSKYHHTALCEKESEEKKSEMLVTTNKSVFLESIEGVVSDNKEKKSAPVKVLLDKCAQTTYIVERLVQKLGLQSEKSHNVKINGFADEHGKKGRLKQYSFCVKNPKVGCNVYLKGLAVPFISPSISGQRLNVAISNFPELKGLNLSSVDDDRDIDILIGSDYYNKIVGDEKRRFGESGELVATCSKLGWLLSGPCTTQRNGDDEVTTSHQLLVGYQEEDDALSEQVKKFWSLDTIGIVDNEKSVYDEFLDKAEFVEEEQRYQVRLPFKEDQPLIADNYKLSLNRLMKLKSKFDKNENLRDRYDEVMQKQIELGIIEKVETDPVPGKVCYLSHFAVIRDEKDTSKLRVVYNGSAKTIGPSFNESLYKGENLNPLLFDILLRFRAHAIALSADIEAAYLQILVHPEDRDYMRLLYFDDVKAEEPEIVTHRFTRVIFGASSSHFSLTGVLRMHAEKYNETDPGFAERLLRYLYADDYNGGAPERKCAAELYEKIKSRFAEANFNFRKWHTNDDELQKFINEREGIDESVTTEAEKVRKVLGIRWTNDDNFLMKVSSYVKGVDERSVSKRQVLKIIGSMYDPVGFITSYVVKVKIFFQEICKLGVSWDKKLDENLTMKWLNIVKQFKEAEDVIVSRPYISRGIDDPVVSTDMIGFSDASEKAYGCVLYFRFTRRSGDMQVSFVTSKSRVTPIKKKEKDSCTLPRCELLGNLCLSQLVANVRSALDKEMTFDNLYCYGDSEISIAWIRAVSKEFKTFVQNRVQKIRKNVDKDNWFYCKSEENPADIITRDDKDPMSQLWWHGPKFLYNEKDFNDSLKTRKCDTKNPDFDAEIRVITTTSLPAIITPVYTIGCVIDINRYNDFLKLLRVTAFVLRFISNIKAKREKKQLVQTSYVLPSEYKAAKLAWIKDNQSSLDGKQLREIKNNLNLQHDTAGVLRSYSRLKNAKLAFNRRAPIFINREHKLADIIVYYSHLKVLHRGVKQTLTEMRGEYWITRGRSFVKKLLHPCTTCKKLNSRAYRYPGHSDLPELRFDDRYPFSSTGMDYLGPLYCFSVYGKKDVVHKAYMVLFTCASTRAVSLEVVHNAESDIFTDAFTRFVSRRGCPNVVVSDNGPAFDARETKNFLASHFVEWKPILAAAPWWGGMYERLVGSVKRCIKKVVGIRTLTYIELQTLAAEIEMILNNRPIGADYDDDVEEVLTPNHLIFGRMLSTTGDQQLAATFEAHSDDLTRRKRALNVMLDHFWERWRREYVTALREVQRVRNRGGEQIKEGDVVLVFEEKVPRHRWRIAKVEKLLPSSDGQIRGAAVKIGKTGSLIQRPINKLYPFVQRNEHNEDSNDVSSIFKTRSRTNDGINTADEVDNALKHNATTMAIPEDETPNEGATRAYNSSKRTTRKFEMPMYENYRGIIRREAAIVGEIRRRLGNS